MVGIYWLSCEIDIQIMSILSSCRLCCCHYIIGYGYVTLTYVSPHLTLPYLTLPRIAMTDNKLTSASISCMCHNQLTSLKCHEHGTVHCRVEALTAGVC